MTSAAQEGLEQIRWEVAWNLLVLAFAAVLLLPMGRWSLLWELTRAFMLLWGLLLMLAAAVERAQSLLRVEEDPPSDAYVLSNLAVGVVLLVSWGGYTALLIRESARGAPVWVVALLQVVGIVASHAAFSVVAGIYRGSLYRTVNMPVAVGGYVLFSAWPPAARALFGWLM